MMYLNFLIQNHLKYFSFCVSLLWFRKVNFHQKIKSVNLLRYTNLIKFELINIIQQFDNLPLMSLFVKAFFIITIKLIFAHLYDSKKLILVQSIARHGARFPIHQEHFSQTNISTEGILFGQLTTSGEKMQYLLGKKLHDEYWEKLFNNTPQMAQYNSKKFYFKSTDINRTIQSAQSFKIGFFQKLQPLKVSLNQVEFSKPPWNGIISDQGEIFPQAKLFYPIAIHIQKKQMSPKDSGDFLNNFLETSCLNQKYWAQQNLSNPKIKSIISDSIFQNAINKLQIEIYRENLTFFQASEYFDTFQCMKFLNKPFLSNFFNDKKNQETLRLMYTLRAYMKYFYTEKQIKATATGLFNATINNIKVIIADGQRQKYIHYSAHDLTIMNIFAAMNITNAQCIYDAFKKNMTTNNHKCILQYPPFTSSLIFQVYQVQSKTDNSKRHTVKMRFNGDYLKIPFCEWLQECSIDSLYQFYQRKVRDQNVIQSCGIQIQACKQKIKQVPQNQKLNPQIKNPSFKLHKLYMTKRSHLKFQTLDFS